MEPKWTAAMMLGVFGLAAGWVVAIDLAPLDCPAPRVERTPRVPHCPPEPTRLPAFGDEFAKDLGSRLAASDAEYVTDDLGGSGYRIVAVTYGSIVTQDSVTVGTAVHGAVDAARARDPMLNDCSKWRFDGTVKETIHVACILDPNRLGYDRGLERVRERLQQFTAARSPKDHPPGAPCIADGECVDGTRCIGAKLLPACDGEYCCSPKCGSDADCASIPGTVCPDVGPFIDLPNPPVCGNPG